MTPVNPCPMLRLMSTTLLAHLERIARETQRHCAADNADGMRAGRYTNVTDFYRPLELFARGVRS